MISLKRGLLMVAALGLLAVAFSVLGSQQTAQADPSVPTNAIVDPSLATPPHIECKWELPDMRPGFIGTEFPDPRVQYGTLLFPHQHDDDMLTPPSVNPACSGPPLALPTQPQNVHNMEQVRPLPFDLPEKRIDQLWMAVDHPAGISAISGVYWHIWEPPVGVGKCKDPAVIPTLLSDGKLWCFKVKVVGTQVTGGPLGDCAKLGTSTTVGTMFEAAVHIGQISAAAVDDVNKGLVASCQQSVKAIFFGDFSKSKEQPCGEYRVEAHAVSGGKEDVLTNYIDVLCFWSLQIDFNRVDWGTIAPGLKAVVGGDLLWDIPPDNRPTVRNGGNHGVGLGLSFDRMCRTGDPEPTCANGIDQFDACFGRTPATLQCIDPILGPPPGNAPRVLPAPTNFDDTRERVLCSDEQGKLDLSVHPPSTLTAGTFTGTMVVFGHTVHNICPTDQGPLGIHTAGGLFGP